MGKRPGSARYGAYAYAVANELLSDTAGQEMPEIARFYQDLPEIVYMNPDTGQPEYYPNPHHKPHAKSPAPFGGNVAALILGGIGIFGLAYYLEYLEAQKQ